MDGNPRSKVPPGSRRPASELIKSLANDGSALLRHELTLARAELRENIASFAKHISQMAVGGGIAAAGLLVFVAFLVIGLGILLGGEYWLSALIVAVALLGTGGLLVFSGIRRIGRASAMPTETIESARETGEWAKRKVRKLRTGLYAGNGPRPDAAAAVGVAPPEGRLQAVPTESRPGVKEPSGAPTPHEGGGAQPRDRKRAPLSQPLYKRVVHEVGKDDVVGQGAKVAFFMFTSLPPALLVLFALAGIYGGDQLGDYFAAQLQQILPGSPADPNSAAAFVNQFIEQVVQTSAPGPLSIGLLLGIWAGSAVFVAMTDALNKAYDLSDDRSWFKRRALSIGVMVGFLLLFILGSVALLAGPQIAGALALGGAANLAWSILQWPLAFGLIVLAFFFAYYALPNRDQSRYKMALLKGSAIAAALWVLATLAFRLYIANFGSYGEVYGFVGAILVILLWLYLTGIVVVLGGVIASEMEREARA